MGNTRAKRIRIFTHDIIIKPTKIPVTKNKNDPHILAIQSLIYIGRKNITIDVTTNILEKLDNKEFIKFKKIMNQITFGCQMDLFRRNWKLKELNIKVLEKKK